MKMFCYPNNYSYVHEAAGTPYTIVNDLGQPVTLLDERGNFIARIEAGDTYDGRVIISIDRYFRGYRVVGDPGSNIDWTLTDRDLLSGQPIMLTTIQRRALQEDTEQRNQNIQNILRELRQNARRWDLDPQDLQDIETIIRRRGRRFSWL